ncbi:MAG: hypothetical protein K2L15_00755 [Eubacteriales bacterium]|nr:hypothetical protein [Eubacteriales bacterium]
MEVNNYTNMTIGIDLYSLQKMDNKLWDNAGNLLKDDKATYSYDEFNKTTKVKTFDGNVQINRYDAEGLRYEMEENGQYI